MNRATARVGWGIFGGGCALLIAGCFLTSTGTAPDNTFAGSGGAGASSTSSVSAGGASGDGGATSVSTSSTATTSSESASSSSGSGGGTCAPLELTAGAPNASYTYTLPSWLTFSSPSDGKTSQVGPSSLAMGFGVDVPRARNATGTWGLSIESTRTNVVAWSPTWGAGTGTDGWGKGQMQHLAGVPDPSGATGATRFVSTGSVIGDWWYFVPALAGPVALSTWARGAAGAGSFGYLFLIVDANTSSLGTVTSSAWTRMSLTGSAGYRFELETRSVGGAPAIATPTSIDVYAAQAEPNAKYPSSYIPTTNAPVTRQAERLTADDPCLTPDGWLDAELTFAPNYASGEQMAQHDLLYFDDQNRIYIDTNDTVVLALNAVPALVSDPLTWSREQELTVHVKTSPNGEELTILGATTGSGTKTAALATKLAAGPVTILGGAQGAEECADLRHVRFQ